MRKILVVLMMLVFALVGCSQSPADAVRDGKMEFDESTTVGKAMGGYGGFKKVVWESREDKQGRKLAVVTAIHDKDCSEFNQTGAASVFGFAVHEDGSFEMVDAHIEVFCKNSEKSTISYYWWGNRNHLPAVYQNLEDVISCQNRCPGN